MARVLTKIFFCRIIFLNDKYSARHQQDDLRGTAIRSPLFFCAARNGASTSGWASALRVFMPEPRRAHAQPLAIVNSHRLKNSVLKNGGPALLVSRLSHSTCEYSGFHSQCGLARVLTRCVLKGRRDPTSANGPGNRHRDPKRPERAGKSRFWNPFRVQTHSEF